MTSHWHSTRRCPWLGLYLCRLVAQSHGGQLHFANAQPGLVVSLQLPLGGGPAP